MNSDDYSRFIFIGFDDLKKIKFDKLEQVCDKVFVFVNKEEKSIPFVLVQQLQKLGESVQWIPIAAEKGQAICHFLSFHLGLTHEQTDEDVEFAIISEDSAFDAIIDHLNDLGRSAVRVTENKNKNESASDLNGINWSKKDEELVDTPFGGPTTISKKSEEVPQPIVKQTNGHHPEEGKTESATSSSQNQQLSERIARETIKRLVMSGNRPAAIDALKSYILLQYNNAEINRNIDLIINKLEKTKEIEVRHKEVLYNF